MGQQQTISLPKASVHLDVPSSFWMHWSFNRFRLAQAKLYWYRTRTLLFLYVRLIPSLPCGWAMLLIHYQRNSFYWICLDAKRNSYSHSWICDLHIRNHECKSNSSKIRRVQTTWSSYPYHNNLNSHHFRANGSSCYMNIQSLIAQERWRS